MNVSFVSKVRPRIFVCVALSMCSVVYFEVQIAIIFCMVLREQSVN